MNIANWDDFNKKNKDKTRAFEDLCRLLFLREKKKSSYEYAYDINEAGLEFKPLKCEDGKWYGIQCKYFNDSIAKNKYEEIYSSVHKAIKYFKETLDVIYIYTNADLKENLKENELEDAKKEIEKGKKDSKSKEKKLSARLKIWDECQQNNIELKFLKADNILDEVKDSSGKNLDLYNLYFTDEKVLDFITNLITPKEKTFIESSEFLELKFGNDISLLDIKQSLEDNKFTLILGDAGTGKSLALKKICNYIFKDYTEAYSLQTGEVKESVLFPVLIKLRECTNGNIEGLIRGRLKDYEVSNTNGDKQICYLFDGLDEIPIKDITNIINYIRRVSGESSTKAVIVSSRSESTNLVYLNQVFDWKSHKIDNLTKKEKIQFLKSKDSLEKSDAIEEISKSDLLNDITDIFSLSLLYENFNEIDIHDSKIELIEISMYSLFTKYQKLVNLDILYPKVDNILVLCMEIAYKMQQNKQLYIEVKEIECLIKKMLSVKDIKTINSIIEMLLETCFEKTFSFNLTFKHRRMQEYFLYRKIEEEYYTNPNILRELNLLANKDFMCNIFLNTSLKRALKNNDLFKISALRMLESYLGEEYVKHFKSDIILGDSNSYSEANYKYSERLIELLATYSEEELEELLSNDKLGVLEIFNKGHFKDNTFFKLVNSYWNINKVDIIALLRKYSLVPRKPKVDKELLYYYLNISRKNIDKEKLRKDLKKRRKFSLEYWDIMIAKDITFIESIIADLDATNFDCLCKVILRFENIKILYYREQYQGLFEKITNKVSKLGVECKICAKVLFSFINDDKRFYEELKSEFKKYNKNHFWTWTDNLEISIYMAIILKKTNNLYCSEFVFGAKLIEKLHESKSKNLDVFKEFKQILIGSNFTCKDALNYVNTRLLGSILGNINFEINQIKKFLRVVFNYESVIYINELMFRIYMINKEKFYNLANKSMLAELEKKLGSSETSYYEEIIESIFSLAAMYSEFSLEKRHELLVKGIDTSMCRPEYKSEKFISKDLLECICKGYESFWFDKQKLENILINIYSNLKMIENRTENYNNTGHLKWALKEYEIENDTSNALYSIYLEEFNYSEFNIFNNEEIDLENDLEKYYRFEVRKAPYGSITFWEKIIEYGYKNQKLDTLLESINERIYGIKQVYVYIPIFILLKYRDLKEKVSKIVANNMGREGIYNITRIISLDDGFGDGMKYLNHLLNFMEFLTNNDVGEVKESEWFEYKEKDWKINESDQEAYFIKDRSIKLVWNDYDQREEFFDEWATKHIDKKAYRYDYTLYANNVEEKTFGLVWVDGFRALLPMPKQYDGQIVRRDEYLICRLLNSSITEFNNYIRLSGLKIE